MRNLLIVIICLFAVAPVSAQQKVLPWRWFFVQQNLNDDETITRIKGLVDTAADHGLNGMVLSSGLDSLTRWDPAKIARLEDLRDHCAAKKIEIIPCIFSAGYGGGVLGHDRSFAAALPATMPLIAKDGKAVASVNDESLMQNGDMEEHSGGRFPRYNFHDQPGEVSFVDTEVFKSGKASIRFQDFQEPHGHARIMQEVKLRPGLSYRFSLQIKTEDLAPNGKIQLMVLRKTGKWSPVASAKPTVKATTDWTELKLDFTAFNAEDVRVYAGAWGAKSGKFWIDDLTLTEQGSLGSIVRREGTPLSLTSADGEIVYEEGVDFKSVPNDRRLKAIDLTEGSKIKDGEELTLNCYRTPFVGHAWGRQISVCMSNPGLYPYWEKQAKAIHDKLKVKKVILSMDEIRNGGGCKSCLDRKISMAEILGDCVSKQFKMFKDIDPKIEVLIWSDMFDPNHNARGNYYSVVGDYTGSHKYLPEGIILACWYHKMRDKTLPFFSGLGFRTFGAAYYDGDDLTNPREWLKSLNATPQAMGIMYTTWRRKYELMPAFGKLVSEF